MDKLDVFSLDEDLKVIVTVKELQRLYVTGVVDGSNGERDCTVLVNGDIV